MAKLPKITTEEEWAEFVDTHDMAEYWDDMIPVDPKEFRILRRRKTLVGLEIPTKTMEKVRQLAKQKKKAPEKMLQQWVTQRLRDEFAAM
ncbi:MAG: CopG family antitoxin [bacterium]